MDLQKGGSAGSWRRTMIGLDLRLGPIHGKYGHVGHLDVNKAKISHGYK
jgi:hypothetical protein